MHAGVYDEVRESLHQEHKQYRLAPQVYDDAAAVLPSYSSTQQDIKRLLCDILLLSSFTLELACKGTKFFQYIHNNLSFFTLKCIN